MNSLDPEVEKIHTHREQAEEWLDRAENDATVDAEWCTAMAQVYATLALVAATRELAVNTLVG